MSMVCVVDELRKRRFALTCITPFIKSRICHFIIKLYDRKINRFEKEAIKHYSSGKKQEKRWYETDKISCHLFYVITVHFH